MLDRQISALKHDYSFSLTARAVAEEVVKRLNRLLCPLIEAETYDVSVEHNLILVERGLSKVKRHRLVCEPYAFIPRYLHICLLK